MEHLFYTYLINTFSVQTLASTMLLKVFPLLGDLSWRTPDQPPLELLISKFTLSRSIYCATCHIQSTGPRMKIRQALASRIHNLVKETNVINQVDATLSGIQQR